MAKTEQKRTGRTKAAATPRRRVTPADVPGARGAATAGGKTPAKTAAPGTEPATPAGGVKGAGRGAGGPADKNDKRKKLPADVARAVRAALDKKAQDVVVLDLRSTPAFTDFFILCSGLNTRQVKAIADAVDEALRALKMRPAHTEGYERAEWVLIDYFSFIVHVFTPQTRAFYGLERLWGDAEKIEVSDEPPTTRSA